MLSTTLGSAMVENWRDGQPQLAQESYDWSGVEIMIETLVKRKIIEEMYVERGWLPVSSSLEVRDQGQQGSYHRRRSITNSTAPHVLGIGPADVLSRHGISANYDRESPEEDFCPVASN